MFAPRRGTSDSVRQAVRDFMPAAALAMAGLIGLLAASLWGPGVTEQHLVVSAPWSSFDETLDLIRAADGGLVDRGRFHNIVFAASSRADFADRARRAGAWLVVPSPRISGCFSGPLELAGR